MEKWIVDITEAQLASLSAEQRDLATIVKSPEGKTLLIFRDGFVALKIAAQLGTKRSSSRTVPALRSALPSAA